MQVATGIAEVPSNLIFGRLVKLNSSLPLCVRILSLKVSHTFGRRVPRDNPKPTSVYLRAAKKIGKNDIISIVPGHWIDSQGEPGAAGEREFNLEVSLTYTQNYLFPNVLCELSWAFF
jgi:hypothetical protein